MPADLKQVIENKMKITFASNYFNHHQRYTSDALNQISDSYRFIATSEMMPERKTLGYGETDVPEYVVSYGDDPKWVEAEILNSDVVIIGSAPGKLIKPRIKKSKCVFRYSERPVRYKTSFIKYIVRYIKWHIKFPISKPIYLLCASAYTSYDYSRYGLFKNRAYKWGYFPETKHYDTEKLMQEKEPNTILWCGRFLELKHPEHAMEVAVRLINQGYNFKLKFIGGTGELEQSLKDMVKEKKLDKYIEFLGTMKPYQVRENMEKAGIFLFNADKREGWGAVLNESMNSGCAVVSSHAIGATPYLVKDGENGFIYRSGDVDMLYEKVKYLLDNPAEQKRLGTNAYKTITELWNSEVAVQRFAKISKEILAGTPSPELFKDGPCSKAEIIEDDWF